MKIEMGDLLLTKKALMKCRAVLYQLFAVAVFHGDLKTSLIGNKFSNRCHRIDAIGNQTEHDVLHALVATGQAHIIIMDTNLVTKNTLNTLGHPQSH